MNSLLLVFLGFVIIKALNGIQWEVAHPLTLNSRALIASRDATIEAMGAQ